MRVSGFDLETMEYQVAMSVRDFWDICSLLQILNTRPNKWLAEKAGVPVERLTTFITAFDSVEIDLL